MRVLQTTMITVRVFFMFCMAIFLNSAPWPAFADTGDGKTPPAPGMQNTYTADLAAMMNPDGLMLMAGGYRRWVQETDGKGMPERYTQAGFGLGINPAFAKGSLHAQWQPAAFFNLRLEYDLYRFFGSNYGLLSFPDARAEFGKDELEDRKGSEEEATGHRGLIQPTLYAKAGPLLIINQTDLAYYQFSGDGPYFLDLEYDTLVKDNDFVLANRTQFFMPAWKGGGAAILYVGPYYEITKAHDADLTRQRVGGQVYWVPADTLWGMDKPRIYSQMGVNIQDRNREDEMYLTLGFGVDFNR